MKKDRLLCEPNEDWHGDKWLQPLEPKPCCNICYYLKNRMCVEALVCKHDFQPRSPSTFFCSEFFSIDEMKESLKHCPICDSINICEHKYQDRNTKCNDCGHIWVIV